MDSVITITTHTDPTALGAGTMLSQEEVATLCRVTPDTVKRWRSQRKGPKYMSVGKAALYRAGDLVKWLDSNAMSDA